MLSHVLLCTLADLEIASHGILRQANVHRRSSVLQAVEENGLIQFGSPYEAWVEL
jgi:hypothetical protein